MRWVVNGRRASTISDDRFTGTADGLVKTDDDTDPVDFVSLGLKIQIRYF